MQQIIQEQIERASKQLEFLSNDQTYKNQVEAAVRMIIESYKNGGCLFVGGNGGSAADSQHLVAELVVRLKSNRTPIKAFSLTVDTSILTAIGNDFGYENVFSRQIEANVDSRDIFLAISTSGNSPNIIKALEMCKKKKIKSLLLSGPTGGEIKSQNLADGYILAPGENAGEIQHVHLVTYHILCGLIEGGMVNIGLCHYT